MRKRWTRWACSARRSSTEPASPSARSSTPTPSTAARSRLVVVRLDGAFGGKRMLAVEDLCDGPVRAAHPVRVLAGRGLAAAERRPPRRRGSLPRPQLLALRGARRRTSRPRKLRRAMARQLWMLRHGEAVPHDSKPDDERELTPRGRRQSEAAGAALAALNEEFAACYTSPKVRALETAELACAVASTSSRSSSPRSPTASAASTRSRCWTPTTTTRRSSSSATSRRSRRSSTTSPAAASTSRRAASPRSRRAAPAASCWSLAAPEGARGDARAQSRAARITASATSARGCSDASSTNSSGLCALPPRGPSPSTVIGIVAAKWLASDAPPRAAAATRRPSALARALEQRRRGLLGVHARPAPDQLRLQARAADLGRDVRRARPRSRPVRRRAGRRTARRRRGRR